MLTESWGGLCPVCAFDRILMRYGSSGYYHFDACPKCGFAYGTNLQDIEDTDPLEVWKAILKAEKNHLKGCGLPVSIHGIYLWVMSFKNSPDKDRNTVFIYDKKCVEDYKKSKLYKSRIHRFKEMVVFT